MDGINGVMSQNDLKLLYENPKGFKIFSGPSLKPYPEDIREKDRVFYIQIADSPLYRIFFGEQLRLSELVIKNTVRSYARIELKAKVFDKVHNIG